MNLPLPIPFEKGQLITEPGLYRIDEELYHADVMCSSPSLSSTVARLLLNSSPLHAWFAHPRLNPDREEKTAATLDMGKAVHKLILGEGRDIEILDFKDYRTNAAQAARDSAREWGKTPMLREQFDKAERLVSVVHGQVAKIDELADLFQPGTVYESAAIWQEGGLWCRAMFDFVRVFPEFIAIVDFKSTDKSAAPATIGKQVFNMGYDVQGAFYRRGLRHVLRDVPDINRLPVRFFLLTQERAGPGSLSIVEPDENTMILADKKVQAALTLWEKCLTADEWPSYPPFIHQVELPAWMENQWTERELRDDRLAGGGWRFAAQMQPQGNDDEEGEEPDMADVLRAG